MHQHIVGLLARGEPAEHPGGVNEDTPKTGLGPKGRFAAPVSIPNYSNADFNSIVGIADSPAAAQWQKVQQQFNLEGTADYLQSAAQQQFAGAYTQLSTAGSLPINPASLEQAASAATGLVLNTSTIQGAISNVDQLISAVESGNGIAVVQSFTGCLVAFGVIAGPETAGISAAIAAGIDLALDLSSLFKGTVVATVCGITITGTAPSFTWGCAWSFAEVNTGGPSSIAWRRFPVASNANDAWWYGHPIASCGNPNGFLSSCVTPAQYNHQWKSSDGATAWWGVVPPFWVDSQQPPNEQAHYARPIDAAFWQYRQLELDVATNVAGGNQATADFLTGYFQAWKANKEYAFNGLAPPGTTAGKLYNDDLHALAAFVQFWNTAHPNSSTFTFQPAAGGVAVLDQDTAFNTSNGGKTYIERLVYEAKYSNVPGILDTNADTMTINTGAPVRRVGTPSLFNNGGATPKTASSSTGTVLLTTAAVIGGLGALGIALYAHAEKMAFSKAASTIWQKAKAEAKKPFSRRKNPIELTRAQIASVANYAAKDSRRPGAPKLTALSSRSELIRWLEWNDRNGIYSDSAMRDEGYDPMTPKEAWDVLAETLSDEIAELGYKENPLPVLGAFALAQTKGYAFGKGADIVVSKTKSKLKKNPVVRQKYSVYWQPEEGGRFELYQSGVSRTRADDLAYKITYVMSPRWGMRNVPTKIVPET